jgi:Heavy-metal resistance
MNKRLNNSGVFQHCLDRQCSIFQWLLPENCPVVTFYMVSASIFLEKGGDGMKKWMKNFTVLSFLLAVIVAGGVCSAEAAGFGYRSNEAALEMMSSPGLSDAEQAALTSALSTYGPAVKTAWQKLRAAREQMKADTETTSPDGSQVATDGTALASAKAQLKAARAQLDSALLAALTPEHLQQLKAQLTAQFQSRLDSKNSHILANYARYLEKQ